MAHSSKPALTTVAYPRIDKPQAYLDSLPLRVRLEKAAALAAKYDEGRLAASEERNRSAARLHQEGFTYAEVGDILGVSATRVKQYVKHAQAATGNDESPAGDDRRYQAGLTDFGRRLQDAVAESDNEALHALAFSLDQSWDADDAGPEGDAAHRQNVRAFLDTVLGAHEFLNKVLKSHGGEHAFPCDLFLSLMNADELEKALVIGYGMKRSEARSHVSVFHGKTVPARYRKSLDHLARRMREEAFAS